MAYPNRGLAWALRPFLIDWLKRRLRPRLFTQLVVALPDDVLQRAPPGGFAEGPSLQSLLQDLTERDLLVVMLLTTPPMQRSRLYSLAAETSMPLPLAFPSIRCPMAPPSGDGMPELHDRAVIVHWDAFEALLA